MKHIFLITLLFFSNLIFAGQTIEQKISKLESLATVGHIESQKRLGEIYYHGYYDLPKDYKKAMRWYMQAATVAAATNQDDDGAQYKLGYMYYHGIGVKVDYEKALDWYEKAAVSSSSPITSYKAQHMVAYMYNSPKLHGLSKNRVNNYNLKVLKVKN